jgi:hypothetical protein
MKPPRPGVIAAARNQQRFAEPGDLMLRTHLSDPRIAI